MPTTSASFNARSGSTGGVSGGGSGGVPGGNKPTFPTAGLGIAIGGAIASSPSTGLDTVNVDTFQQELNSATNAINTIIQDADQFTNVQTLSQPFIDAFDDFSSTAQEVLLQEVRVAEDDLAAFVNNNPDVRGAVNLTVARQVKGDIFNATLASASAVNQQLAQNIFAVEQLASQNFTSISNTVASASTQLAAVTADFVASLTSTQAQIFATNMDFAANMAQISAQRDIAALNAATTRRGQDVQLSIAQIEAQTNNSALELQAQQNSLAATQPSSTPQIISPTPVPPPPTPSGPARTPVPGSITPVTGTTLNPTRQPALTQPNPNL